MRRVAFAIGFAALAAIGSAAGDSANPVVLENLKAGDPTWLSGRPARNSEIEGYASKTSVNRGEQIELFVNTIDSSYIIEVYRAGWYAGAGARRVFGPVEVPGKAQPLPVGDATGLIECDWKDPHVLAILTDWPSGIYVVKLTAKSLGLRSLMTFVVRDDARRSDLLFQASVTTYQAYNGWGGKSLYAFNSTGGIPARKVSFNRPYSADGDGAGQFVFGGGWEYTMVRFLEREGFDVTYCTNIDVHQNPALLLSHKAFLSVGHDEYWSWDMRANVTLARDRGVHVGFFSANTCYWQIRLEPSARTGAPNRTIVAYKEQALTEDPYLLDQDPSNDRQATTKWRNPPVNMPEQSLIGVMYLYRPVDADVVIENPSHWVFDGTGAVVGTRLPHLLGYEVDMMGSASPFNTVRLAHSPFIRLDGTPEFSDMTIYEAAGGAVVFAAGTIWWSWGLDSFNSGAVRPDVTNRIAQQMTRNILNRFAGIRTSARRRSARH